jgi:hypothetical protein
LPQQLGGPVVPLSAQPSSLNFGELYSGESRSLTTKIVPGSDGRDGDATISLEGISPALGRGANPVFKIVEVQAWGLNAVPAKPTTKNPGVVRGPATSSGVQSSGVQKGPTGITGIPLNGEQPHLIQSVTRPPFKVHLRPGDQLIIKVDAAPVLDLANGPASGNYSGHLRAQGAGWTADIPVAENFHGLRLGVMATLEANEDAIYFPESYVPSQSYPSPLNMTLINSEKAEQHVKIHATSLPGGVSLPLQEVVIAAGKTTTVALPFSIKWGVGALGLGASQKAQLEIASEAGKKALPFVFTVRPSYKSFDYEGHDGIDWAATVTIYRDGRFNVKYQVTNDNVLFSRSCQFLYQWNGHKIFGFGVVAKRRASTTDQYGVTNSYIREHYNQMLEKPPELKVTYKNTG